MDYTMAENPVSQLKFLRLSISLQNLCFHSVTTGLAKVSRTEPLGIDALRNYLTQNLPPRLGTAVLEFGVRALLPPRTLLSLLFILPKASFETKVDLIGSLRPIEISTQNFCWGFGFHDNIALDGAGTRELCQVLSISDLSLLESLSFWTNPGSLGSSHFEKLLLRAPCLTFLALRGGASDGLLRTIGLSCPNLRHLDVSRSPQLTSLGLRNLFLLRPTSEEAGLAAGRTVMAARLQSLLVSRDNENLSPAELLLVSVYMDRAYVWTSFIDSNYRFTRTEGSKREIGLVYSSKLDMGLPDQLKGSFGEEDWVRVQIGLAASILDSASCELDFEERTGGRIQVLVRHATSYLVKGLVMLNPGLGITRLSLFWAQVPGHCWVMPVLADLVRALPNLETFQGRVEGDWDEVGPIFPRLRTLDVWTGNERTAIAFLRHCPALRSVELKVTRLRGGTGLGLTDEVLRWALVSNPGLRASLEDLLILPTKFTRESLAILTEACPRLWRIGDLECWDISEEDKREISGMLKSRTSACTLVRSSFPPKPALVNLY